MDSSIEDKPITGNQLIKIIKDNELDGGPLVIHVIGSDGAMVYSRIAGIMNDYINGAILETLPSPDQAVGAQVRPSPQKPSPQILHLQSTGKTAHLTFDFE